MDQSQWLKLIGVAIVIVGFALRLRPTLVVVIAGIATGLVAHLPVFSHGSVEGIVPTLGRSFVDNRLMTLFVITLPTIGLMERFGLQVQAARIIRRIGAATAGRLLILYQIFRVVVGMLGLRLGGHATFVRPLIYPMSIGAAESRGKLSPKQIETIKAADAASENYGNFYGQNLSPVQPGILLVYSVMKGLGYSLDLWRLVLFAIPIAAASVVIGMIQFLLLDWRLRRKQ